MVRDDPDVGMTIEDPGKHDAVHCRGGVVQPTDGLPVEEPRGLLVDMFRHRGRPGRM